MENASKALLMAAEVLIGILVLTLGMYLYMSFSATSKELQEESARTQIDIFNAQFTSIANKENITIYDVVTLANLAKENNEKNNYIMNADDTKDLGYISINLETKESTIKNLEKKNEDDLNDLIKKDKSEMYMLNAKNGIHINETTLRIDEINLKYK